MTREELQNKFGDAICEYCRNHVISEYNLRKGWVCENSTLDELVSEGDNMYDALKEAVELISDLVDELEYKEAVEDWL